MLVYGKNVAEEIIKFAPKTIRKIQIQENFGDKSLISLMEKANLRVEYKTKVELDKLANGIHQGIILDVTDYQYHDISEINDNTNFVLILDHLEDVHNFGAIIRTAEAAGVDFIIVPKTREVLVNATVIKTSAGTAINSKIVKVSNINNTILKLKKLGFWVVGTTMDGIDYRKIDYSGKIALVIGNEGKGMSSIVRNSCDFLATIPMYGDINSLNASVASGIMIYEVVRNRK